MTFRSAKLTRSSSKDDSNKALLAYKQGGSARFVSFPEEEFEKKIGSIKANVLGRHACRTKSSLNFDVDTKNGRKTRKKMRKTIRNVTEKVKAPLRLLENFSLALSLKIFHRPKLAQFFAGVATLKCVSQKSRLETHFKPDSVSFSTLHVPTLHYTHPRKRSALYLDKNSWPETISRCVTSRLR